MLACCRGMYALAARNQGPKAELFRQVDPVTNMPSNSAILSLGLDAFWLLYFYGANLTEGWFGYFNFDSSELPIVTAYAFYIPMFICWMIKEKEMGFVKRFLLPSIATLACGFMVFAAVYAHGITPYIQAKANGAFSFPVLFYLILFAVIMLIGVYLRKPKNKAEK